MLRWHRFPRQAGLLIIGFVALGVLALPSVGAANPPTPTPPMSTTNAPVPPALSATTSARFAAPAIPIPTLPPPCMGTNCFAAPLQGIAPLTAGSGTVTQLMLVRNLGIVTTETTARFTFDTAVEAQVSLRADNERPVEVFAHFADERTAATHHDLTLTTLIPWSRYRYTLILAGETSASGTGVFATQPVALTNVRVQPDTTSVQIWFDSSVPVDAIVTIRSLYDAYHVDLSIPQAYRAWLQQPGLKPGTDYKFTITISGQEAFIGTFGTDITIDNGPALVPAGG